MQLEYNLYSTFKETFSHKMETVVKCYVFVASLTVFGAICLEFLKSWFDSFNKKPNPKCQTSSQTTNPTTHSPAKLKRIINNRPDSQKLKNRKTTKKSNLRCKVVSPTQSWLLRRRSLWVVPWLGCLSHYSAPGESALTNLNKIRSLRA